ncbi:sulfotransferase family protein [Celeribacter litoreus]|uniref:sulfotransferase family protein n=1 Tax=Celeribacter litoreus TaxID=2876714 RepID=UPI001CCA7935|nr:sulfotransferase [Celeribacter litoreus]MCA0045082.1 sulfotransferase [Celeribacter litoreus]
MPEPLFILCPGRSFSSVLSAVIGQHPDAFGLPEVHLFVTPTVGEFLDMDAPLLGRRGATTGLRRAVAELVFKKQTKETVDQARDWLMERREKTGAEVFRELCEIAGNRVMVDKSPTNSEESRLEEVYRAFPNAKYLHLSRHPRATCRSQYKAYAGRSKYSQRAKKFDHEVYWYERHHSILNFSQRLNPDQYMFLHGEWFFEHPETFLEQICEWLGLSTDKKAIRMMMKPEESPFAVMGPENAPYGNNVGFIEKPHLRVGRPKQETLEGPLEWVTDHETYFTEQTRSLAYQLGYDT